jgi:transposase
MGDPIRGRVLSSLRRRAIEMAAAGAMRGQICDELGIAPSTAWRWVKLHREQGDTIIDKAIGRPSRLSPDEVTLVIDKLLLGPEANGYDTPLWTLSRIADMIRTTTGVSYNTNYIAVFMHGLGWSCQKPERRAKERNEEAIAGWVRDEWPDIKKKPKN